MGGPQCLMITDKQVRILMKAITSGGLTFEAAAAKAGIPGKRKIAPAL
jgi:hypothetical protein